MSQACEHCGGSGIITGRFGAMNCEACRGRGWIDTVMLDLEMRVADLVACRDIKIGDTLYRRFPVVIGPGKIQPELDLETAQANLAAVELLLDTVAEQLKHTRCMAPVTLPYIWWYADRKDWWLSTDKGSRAIGTFREAAGSLLLAQTETTNPPTVTEII